MARDWVPALLVMIAYCSVEWVPQLHNDHALENAVIAWDRTLMNEWALRSAIERFGRLLPATLKLSYLLVYAVPPLAIAYSTFAGSAGGSTISCSRSCSAPS